MTCPTGNNHVPVGYQPQMARGQLRQDQGQVVVQVATKRVVPAPATPVKVVKAANPVVVTPDGHQVVGTREKGKPNVVVTQKTVPSTARVVGTIGTSAVTHQPVFRPELYKK